MESPIIIRFAPPVLVFVALSALSDAFAAAELPPCRCAQPQAAAEPFDLADVKLLDGPFKRAQELDRKYLLGLPTDRLTVRFQAQPGKTAGGVFGVRVLRGGQAKP